MNFQFMFGSDVLGRNPIRYLLIIKITLLILLIAIQSSVAKTFGQTVNLTAVNQPLTKVLLKIRKQTGYNIIYNDQMLEPTVLVNVSLKNVSITMALDKCLKDQPLSYVIDANTIIIRPKLKVFGPTTISFFVKGIVKDSKGVPIPGVSILIKGTSTGTTTNSAGKYSLSVPDENTVLVFTSLGYVSQEIVIGSRKALDVVLVDKSSNLNEVVVVGYGTQRRQDLTGSVASISEKDIKSRPITSADQALQGRAPGVQVTQNSNAPGGATTIRIRGGNSIQGGNEPLYVIDGLPVYNDAGNSGANLNALSAVDPNDIQSIEILKDASATAIYGSRGANGVVIVTTKRGKSGDTRINFDTYYGAQQVRRKYPLLNATEYALLTNEANTNDGAAPIFSATQVAAFGQGTDWQNEILRKAPIQNYNLSLNGGDEKTQFAISGSYFNQQGIVNNSDFKRGGVRLNIDRTVSKKIKIGTSVALTRSFSNRTSTDGALAATGSVIANALQISPIVNVRAADGSYTLLNVSNGGNTDNPVALAADSRNLITLNRLLGSVYREYQITKDLKFKTLFGLDGAISRQQNYLPKSVLSGSRLGGQAFISNDQAFTWLNENTLTYTTTLNDIHNITALAGFTLQDYRLESNAGGSRNFISDQFAYRNLGLGSVSLTPSSGVGTWGLQSFLGRVNYGYKNKYLITATARYDGSSRFGSNHRFGFFPSASFAWRLSEEEFIKNSKTLSNLKLRASYGSTGNQEGIGNYPSLAILGTQNYPFGGVIIGGIGPSQIANPDLKWESTAQADIGLDAGFFNNRLNVTFDVYRKRTSDLLLSITIPSTTGYTSALKNLGKVENKGIELGINTQNFTGSFTWSTDFNIAYNKNTVLDIGSAPQIFAGQNANIAQNVSPGIIRVGLPLGSFFGFVTDGVFQTSDNIPASAQPTAKPGDRRYKDLNGDKRIDDNDRAVLGHAQPDYVGGLTNNFSFKGFDCSFFFQGVKGNKILNANRYELEYLNGTTNLDRDMLNRWTPTNPNTDIPRASVNRPANRVSTRQIEDGSYLRLKNIQIGYNIPQKIMSRAGLKSLRLYVSAENLITWTRYSGYDPEVSRFGQDNLSQGFDYGSYPASKTLLIGLKLGL